MFVVPGRLWFSASSSPCYLSLSSSSSSMLPHWLVLHDEPFFGMVMVPKWRAVQDVQVANWEVQFLPIHLKAIWGLRFCASWLYLWMLSHFCFWNVGSRPGKKEKSRKKIQNFDPPKDRKDPPMEGWTNLHSRGFLVLKIARPLRVQWSLETHFWVPPWVLYKMPPPDPKG